MDKESSGLKNDEPEVRDEISTPTFEYEIAYYMKDHTPIYQFKVKEESKKQSKETDHKKGTKETEQKKHEHDLLEDEPLDLSMKSSSTLNATQISTPYMYSPVSYTMDYVTKGNCVQVENKPNHNKKSHNKMPMIGRGKPFPTAMFTDEDTIDVNKLPRSYRLPMLVQSAHNTQHMV